jgi:hypothetical protein
MTDGMMSGYANETLQLVQSSVFNTNQRLYAIGIGQDADTVFITRLAQAGLGDSAFVLELLDFYSTLSGFLNQSISYYAYTSNFTYDVGIVGALTPLPQTLTTVYYNEAFHLYVLFNTSVL